MQDALFQPGRAIHINAPVIRLALLAHYLTAANRAGSGENEGLLSPRVLRILNHGHDLGNHIAAALHRNVVPDLHPQPLDFVSIMQGSPAYCCAANKYRMQQRDRGQLARATHLYCDVIDLGDAGAGGELVSHGPAWRAPGITETALQRRLIDLDDDAVNLVTQSVALPLRPGDKSQQLVHIPQVFTMSVDAKACAA